MKRTLPVIGLLGLAALAVSASLLAAPAAHAAEATLVKPIQVILPPNSPAIIFEKVTVSVESGGSYMDGITYHCDHIGGGLQTHEYTIGKTFGAFTNNYEDAYAFNLQSGTSLIWAVATGKVYRGPGVPEGDRWYASTGGGAGDEVTVP